MSESVCRWMKYAEMWYDQWSQSNTGMYAQHTQCLTAWGEYMDKSEMNFCLQMYRKGCTHQISLHSWHILWLDRACFWSPWPIEQGRKCNYYPLHDYGMIMAMQLIPQITRITREWQRFHLSQVFTRGFKWENNATSFFCVRQRRRWQVIHT